MCSILALQSRSSVSSRGLKHDRYPSPNVELKNATLAESLQLQSPLIIHVYSRIMTRIERPLIVMNKSNNELFKMNS